MNDRSRIVIEIDSLLTKLLILCFPIFIIAVCLYIRHITFETYGWLAGEDGPFEDLTALIYIFTMLLSLIVGLRFYTKKHHLPSILFLLFAIACFIVAGEEISWGQRLLGIQTQEVFTEHNVQNEMNLHNMAPVQRVLHGAYILVGLGGSLLWLLHFVCLKGIMCLLRDYIVPPWYLISYFIPVALFYTYMEFVPRSTRSFMIVFYDQELPELMLSFGFFILLARAVVLQINQNFGKQLRFMSIYKKGSIRVSQR